MSSCVFQKPNMVFFFYSTRKRTFRDVLTPSRDWDKYIKISRSQFTLRLRISPAATNKRTRQALICLVPVSNVNEMKQETNPVRCGLRSSFHMCFASYKCALTESHNLFTVLRSILVTECFCNKLRTENVQTNIGLRISIINKPSFQIHVRGRGLISL